MATKEASILITYNDTQDQGAAERLAHYLINKEKSLHISRGLYNDNIYTFPGDWLIVFNPSTTRASKDNVQKILTQVTSRQKCGVLVVTTTSSGVPDEWKTVRQYSTSDAENNPAIETEAFEGIWRATEHAKLPYSKAPRGNFVGNALSSVKAAPRKSLIVAIVWILLAIVIVMGAFAATATFLDPSFIPTRLGIISQTPSQTTATLTKLQRKQTAIASQAKTAIAATQTASASQPTPTIDTNTPGGQLYANTIKNNKATITGFQQAANGWDITSKKGTDPLCYFDNQTANKGNYHAVSEQANTYTPCLAQKTKFQNFVYQVNMTINNGYAGGVIFRDDGLGDYYRFALEKNADQPYGFTIFICYQSGTGVCSGQAGEGSQLANGSVPDTSIIPNQPITLAVIAQDTNVYFYINRVFLMNIVVDTHKFGKQVVQAGWIGVLAASTTTNNGATPAPTDVTFSDLKVWGLD